MSDSNPIRVLHFLNSPHVPGGVEEHVRALVEVLPSERFEITLVCPSTSYPMFAPLTAPHRRICCLDLSKMSQVGAMRRMVSLLRAREIEVAHSHQFYATLFLAPLARMCGVPWIVETTHVREAWRRSWLKRSFLVDRLVYSLVDRFIAVSRANKTYLVSQKHCSPSKVVLIHNGRDLSRFRPTGWGRVRVRNQYNIAPSDVLLVHVGRLELQKGHHVLMRALPSICKAVPQVKVLLVGEGSLCTALEEEIRSRGLARTVAFAGFQTSVQEFLEAADLVVLPSLWEGLPLVPIEAGAMGKAVVATAVDGTPEVVVDDQTGVLVEPSNSDQLAEAIIALLHDEVGRRRMGEAAAKHVYKHFSLSVQVEKTARLYESLVGPRRIQAGLALVPDGPEAGCKVVP